ncbi:hypothetical protein [Parabacteroides sp. AM08-6]|nr:hypothetical protein [Parabacteroides sp. AM08-6]
MMNILSIGRKGGGMPAYLFFAVSDGFYVTNFVQDTFNQRDIE